MLFFVGNVAGVSGCRAGKRRRWISVSMAVVDPERIGLGGYRLSNDIQKHRRALETALVSGVQVVDTAVSWYVLIDRVATFLSNASDELIVVLRGHDDGPRF
mmetsp:Transcript_8221/g.36666  ORF Transcript_8221/g.36666 Transcript_8221/m.36666 type:complete len:102 (+) Transcript_8221:133-438(+)